MKTRFLLLLFLCALPALAQKTAIDLPSSKQVIEPVPGDARPAGSFPVTAALSPDGNYLALLDDGYGRAENAFQQGIVVIDLRTGHSQEFPDSRLGKNAHQTYFLGLSFSADGRHLYASVASLTDPGGTKPGDLGNGIAVYSFNEGQVMAENFFAIAPQTLADGKHAGRVSKRAPKGKAVPYPAGLALAGVDRLLVADNLSDDVLLLSLANGAVIKRFDVSAHKDVPAEFPYEVVASRDGRRAWCSLWNASRVVELDLKAGKVARSIPLLEPQSPTAAGSHPTALLLSPNEKFLYVALANADKVAVVDAAAGKAVRFLSTTLPGQEFPGTYPNALAQTADGKRLFVANASSDSVAVFDTSSAGERALGFIPTEWYPTALAVRDDDLFIATAKGRGTGPNTQRVTTEQGARRPYILWLMQGSLARVSVKSAERDLAALTRDVAESNRMNGRADHIPFPNSRNPIRHVIYIIKENRTYDQIFGDLPVGDGDVSLTLYGDDITPNAHKLAKQFGVIDNFYDSGEVSGNGHVWSTAAISSDYTEKTVQIAYRGREHTYDYEGGVADEFPLEQGEPDANEPGTGYLWTNLAKHKVTFRHYGEYVTTMWCDKPEDWQSPLGGTPLTGQTCPHSFIKKGEPLTPNVGTPHGSASPYPWPVPIISRNIATKPELRDHFDPRFADFRLDYPDQLRADEFLNEFNGWTANTNEDQMPRFILMRLPNDHTAGKRPGMPKPVASVADNDLALGRVVDAVSHSPRWNDTAIFVLEDDAQDGADHVDAHRSIALVISKYSPKQESKPFVDHHFYTTVNLIHTMEVLLELPPMNNNDARAALMSPLFTGSGEQAAFSTDFRNRDNGIIYEMNPGEGKDAEVSQKMDFSHADANDAAELNRVLWRDRKGDVPMPAAKHGMIFGND